MSSGASKDYLAKYGKRLIDAGYRVVPIIAGEKQPIEAAWTSIQGDKRLIDRWLDGWSRVKNPETKTIEWKRKPGRYVGAGCGILTRDTPAIDVDVSDADVSARVEAFAVSLVGAGPVRIGRAPKVLLLCRTNAPFAKLTSTAYVDSEGRKQQVEILGDGQQFVALHVHPNTGRPYKWPRGGNPTTVRADELPELTEAHARRIIEFFEAEAELEGWQVQSKSRNISLGASNLTQDDFVDVKAKTIITEADLERKLLLVPQPNEYERWLQVGMALYHQYEGGDRGLELWHRWSEQANNYDSDALDEKWPTFDEAGKGRIPLTARFIIKLADEAQREIATAVYADVQQRLTAASTKEEFLAVCTIIKHTEFDQFTRTELTGLAQAAFKRITKTVLPIKQARQLLRYESPEGSLELPHWLQGFVYCRDDETFFNTRTRAVYTTKGFNETQTRNLLTKADILEGKAVPDQSASAVALNLYQIPEVEGKMYLPGASDLFTYNGLKFANRYDDRNVPEIPIKYTFTDKANIATVRAHFEHLLASEDERRALLDFLAYVVQNPGKRVSWAVMIQGTPGDGKTFFWAMMAAVLGLENTRTLNAQALEENTNSWAEGSQFVFVEEVKLQGHNRHDVLNKVKPLITNPVVSIRRMRTDFYDRLNTTTYMLATNFRDALPLDDNDRRYMILFSRWQTKSGLALFRSKSKDYYNTLYNTLAESPGAIRKWLLSHEISADFQPSGDAPDTRAKREMAGYARTEEAEALIEILDDAKEPDLCRALLNLSKLNAAFMEYGVEMPQTQKLAKYLLECGLSRLGRVRAGVKRDEAAPTFWSDDPYRFLDEKGRIDQLLVRDYIANPL